ncbi:MAG: dockerin type I repeat-containing protein [Clostridia bacterium]|nr:dockerin type I repeat-containing protein [Clostridia bacterium]
MKTENRLLTLALALIMCFALLPAAAFAAPEENAVAGVTQSYMLYEDGEWSTYEYSTVYYPSIQEAFNAAAAEPDYKNDLDLTEDQLLYFSYNNPVITLCKDVTIAKGETVLYNTHMPATVDLNGHTLDIKGEFSGSYEGERYDSEKDEMVPCTYSANVIIESKVPGVFRSSGVLDVMLQTWTADTYYITGGQIKGYFGADGGNINISGGVFSDGAFFNNGSDAADLTVTISGSAEFFGFDFWVYADENSKKMKMTVDGEVKISRVAIGIMGEYYDDKPYLVINGAYFDEDPHVWIGGYEYVPDDQVDREHLEQYFVYKWGEFISYTELDEWDRESFTDYYLWSDDCLSEYVVFGKEPELFERQTDWKADSGIYNWRIKGLPAFIPGDVNGNNKIDTADYAMCKRAFLKTFTLNEEQLVRADINGNSKVDASEYAMIKRHYLKTYTIPGAEGK